MKRVIYGSVLESTLGYSPTTHTTSLGTLKTAQKASLCDFEFDKRQGYLYVAVRAVSSRVNQNYDGFTGDELRKAYETFIGRPVFVNHQNSDLNRARGFVIDARLVEDDPNDVHVVVLHELDAVTYPKLCGAIASGQIDTTSMGCNIDYSECSVCGVQARFPSEFCNHMQNKGAVFERKTASGGIEKVLAYEGCCGVNFFEDSWVFNPADSSAVIQGVMDEAMKIAQTTNETHRPDSVDTLRSVEPCPQCGNENYDGVLCETCGFSNTPETTKAPDTEKAKDSDLPIEEVKPKSVADSESKGDTKKPKDDKSKKESAMPNKSTQRTQVLFPENATQNPNARRGGMDMPRIAKGTAAEVARARFVARRAQVDTGLADLTTDVTNLDGESSVPSTVTPDTTTTVETQGAEITPAAAPAESVTALPTAEVAPINEVLLPVATDSSVVTAPVNPPVFPELTAPDGEAMGVVEPLPSVTAARSAFIAGMRLVEARIAGGLEPRNVDKVALADKFSRELSLREMHTASTTIGEMLTKQATVTATRGMVPRHEGSTQRPVTHVTRTASTDVPPEAIFGLN